MHKIFVSTLIENDTHVWNCNNVRRCAFTLAEVLITLGIIGIVAALTIPTLITNYNTKQWNTAATVFDRKLKEALKTMNTQSSLAGHLTTESFVKELSEHFKINKICQNDQLLDCFNKTVYWGGGEATPKEIDMAKIKKAKNFGQDDWDTNIVGVQFANGVSALIAYNSTTGDSACTQDPYSNQITGSDCLAILYDTSADKNPNTSGKDLRSNGNVTSLGSGCLFEIGGTCYVATTFYPTPYKWNDCDSSGKSQDPDDLAVMAKYGIKYCHPYYSYSDDYWTGAVIACGGKDKIPTMEQLSDIADFLYNIEVPSQGITGVTRDETKVTSLGFKPGSFDSIKIWSNSERNTDGKYIDGWTFDPTQARVFNGGRGSSSNQAICIE